MQHWGYRIDHWLDQKRCRNQGGSAGLSLLSFRMGDVVQFTRGQAMLIVVALVHGSAESGGGKGGGGGVDRFAAPLQALRLAA